MILKVNQTLINLANVTRATVKPDFVRFFFVVPDLEAVDFSGEQARAIHSYIEGHIYSEVSDVPFVDVMAHYRAAQRQAGDQAVSECVTCEGMIDPAEVAIRAHGGTERMCARCYARAEERQAEMEI